MTTPSLVIDFYQRIWNAGNQPAVSELLSEEFVFRGSLGPEMRGRARFWDYVREIRSVLANYRCDVAGDTAVVVETDTLRSATNGQPSTTVYRFTVTYIKRGGHWFALAEHGVAAK